MKPVFIPQYISAYLQNNIHTAAALNEIKNAYQVKLVKGHPPDISIVMPAYNEEENIIPTLTSLCNNIIDLSVEIIVVNNNSSDKTEELVKACGIRCILETTQGITPARNA